MGSVYSQSFLTDQKKNSRVKTAYSEKESALKKLLSEHKIENLNVDIYLRIFKQEKILELWAKPKTDKKYSHIKDYEICASSGELGPKRAQGDGQTPEGFYFINRFNPYSNFYLSLGLNYPNQADLKVIGNAAPGGDIFIHGNCVTIGCIPITDDKIKELYLIAIEAKSHGQEKIPVHVFPCKLTEGKMAELKSLNPNLLPFWISLKAGFDYFEKYFTVPVYKIDKQGNYVVTP
jgi:murein L,D-transpeptidase YafK